MGKVSSITKAIAAAVATIGVSAMTLSSPVMADPLCSDPKDCASQGAGSVGEGSETDLMDTVQIIINVVIYVVGLIAVVMIILGGIQYTTSQGDAGKVKKAKDTILYGIIGLVVAILAFAVVNFVLGSVFPG